MDHAFGVDVSHHVPVVDFSKLADAVAFVGVKATEGPGFVDPKLRFHRSGVRQYPFALAIYYHFARSGDPRKQAQRLMDTIGPMRDNERLALDLEVSPAADVGARFAWMNDFFEELLGGVCSDRRPILYTSNRKWVELLGDPPLWDLASEVDLWLARYSHSEPVVPKPWANVGWKFWQFSDGHDPEPRTVPGVGTCDCNYFNGDLAALRAYARVTSSSPPPQA